MQTAGGLPPDPSRRARRQIKSDTTASGLKLQAQIAEKKPQRFGIDRLRGAADV
jgi:hypothetical protein